MKNSTLNYVLKRVLVFLVISVIIMLFNACEVHAETYTLENTNTIARFYPSGTNNNLLWSTLYYNNSSNIVLSGWDFNMYMPSSAIDNMLYNGRYLFSFYVFGVGTFRDLQCNEMTSNFKNINRTTGNMVQNEITSKCLDIYRTTYQGYNAYRFLYEFTYNSQTGPDGINEVDFTFYSAYNPIVSFDSGMNYGFEVANINDYDLNIINTWNTDKSQQTIINQGQTQIQQNETIINQQNTNTTSIINNQEQNTQEIINNQNQNTQDMIDSQKVCTYYDKNNMSFDNKYLDSSGNVGDNNEYALSDYLPLTNKDELVLLTKNDQRNLRLCFYNVNKTFISCLISTNLPLGNITIPDNTSYVRLTVWKSTNKPTYNICKNGNQALVDSLTDDSIPSDSDSKINAITDKIKENQNSNIVQLATFIPQMLQLIINGMNTNCTGGYSLGSLYGTELIIPCINPVNYLGSFLWGVIDSILCLCYLIPLCKFLVNKYNDLTSMKNLRWQ